MQLYIRQFRASSGKKVAVSVDAVSSPVESLKEAVASVTNISPDQQDIVYAGKVLQNHTSLESYGVKAGATLHVVQRLQHSRPAACPVIATIPSFRDALQNPRFSSAVAQIMRNPIVVRELFFSPEVAVSPSIRGLLEQPNFLQRLADPAQMASVFAEHPMLADIAQERLEAYLTSYMVAHGHDNQTVGGSWPPSITDLCEMIEDSVSQFDGMDLDTGDEEVDGAGMMEMMEHHGMMEAYEQQHQQQTAAGAGITASQLASALSSVSSSSPAAQSPAVQQPSSSGGSSGAITADLFSQALAGALQANATQGTSSSTPAQGHVQPDGRSQPRPNHGGREDRRQQLNRMREMGITDEAICIQALEATDGDVMAAVNLIFTDGFL